MKKILMIAVVIIFVFSFGLLYIGEFQASENDSEIKNTSTNEFTTTKEEISEGTYEYSVKAKKQEFQQIDYDALPDSSSLTYQSR